MRRGIIVVSCANRDIGRILEKFWDIGVLLSLGHDEEDPAVLKMSKEGRKAHSTPDSIASLCGLSRWDLISK